MGWGISGGACFTCSHFGSEMSFRNASRAEDVVSLSVWVTGLACNRKCLFFFFILFLTCWDFFHCDLDMFWWDSLKLQRSVDWRNKWMERSGLVCGVSRMVRWANQCSVEQVLILTFKQPAAAKHTLTVTDRSCKQRKVKKTGWICRCKKRKKKGA